MSDQVSTVWSLSASRLWDLLSRYLLYISNDDNLGKRIGHALRTLIKVRFCRLVGIKIRTDGITVGHFPFGTLPVRDTSARGLVERIPLYTRLSPAAT
jgi:hypothetical protein